MTQTLKVLKYYIINEESLVHIYISEWAIIIWQNL